MAKQEIKVYLTIVADSLDNPEWQDLEFADLQEAVESALCDFNYRIEHLPGGYITDSEIK